ncbi:HAD-like domain-containing protein [Protomyces lactucae-debilis]|uniref:HAD-like domain-containing protein n=1 Tax=Protomyces lactucae-debilis TaxID=2754530 RepID=A0A1Y2FGS0_PROLT|nr:HAD-like domain-containing protein [Protomyces lactucae-debilis]ORY83131.1 HAD-like domain-containing protein [Protomyces lactucae-debilis]
MSIKAVVFDLGGVCVASPLHAINAYEKEHGLPHNYLNFMIAKWKSPSPMNRLEMGAIEAVDANFYKLFGEHLSDPEGYEAYLKQFPETKRTKAPVVDGETLFTRMLDATSTPNEPLIAYIRQLKATGKYKVWALTNNFPITTKTDGMLHPLFDGIVGSVQVKLRKPDPRIYQLLLQRLDLPANQVVFLDDIGANLKAAKKEGIRTIQVDFRTTPKAIEQLDAMLGENLKAKL